MKDNINPSHYQRSGMECIDAIRAAVENLTGLDAYCTGNMVKYAWRWKEKNGKEDLQKIQQYAQFLIDDIEEAKFQEELEMDATILDIAKRL